MKQSLRAKRMAKHHRRNKSAPKLNLVSLMDIFTILVFFLLVNSSDVEVLTNDKAIELPASVADTVPDTTVVVKVNNTQILVGGRVIVSDIGKNTSAADDENKNIIAALATELEYLAARARPLTEEQIKTGRSITIMGDKAIPYTLLKRIMNTCAQAGYRDISLAVHKTASSDDEPDEATTGTNQ
ncbi:ExbD/TolR family protein [Gilvimarinus polysaccharolyticus]|uniref:ExbD/TolR family protein n=1 Tax=Gilvimarinus polysaccharolyticus TaxID=863921 RepID=UPI0006735A91|nr:biopolymer transporter ExbD [Gilvimarinus polysaccharolyticus]